MLKEYPIVEKMIKDSEWQKLVTTTDYSYVPPEIAVQKSVISLD